MKKERKKKAGIWRVSLLVKMKLCGGVHDVRNERGEDEIYLGGEITRMRISLIVSEMEEREGAWTMADLRCHGGAHGIGMGMWLTLTLIISITTKFNQKSFPCPTDSHCFSLG